MAMIRFLLLLQLLLFQQHQSLVRPLQSLLFPNEIDNDEEYRAIFSFIL
jgi:hypothetical protein